MSTRIFFTVVALAAVPATLMAQEKFGTQVGDKQVTSIRREVTKGAGLSKEELLDAARQSVPALAAPPHTGPSTGDSAQ